MVEKCPSYFSEKLCGSIPSSKYLVLMFNRYVTAKRQYFDSEVLKCCKRSTLVSLHASYKVGKLLMKYGKEKMYDTLHTMVNEFGQIVQQKFLNGDNHDELEENLLHLNSLGLDPSLVFSDNPERDRSMLQRVFPKLSNGINEEAFKKHVQKLVQVETRSYQQEANIYICIRHQMRNLKICFALLNDNTS